MLKHEIIWVDVATMDSTLSLSARTHVPLHPATSLCGMQVAYSTSSQLVLSYPKLRPILFVIFGILLSLWGLAFWIDVSLFTQRIRENPDAPAYKGAEVPGYAVRGMCLPVVGIALIFDGVRRLSISRVFDGQSRVLRCESFAGTRAWHRDQFQNVQLRIIEGSSQKELLQIGLVHRKSGRLDAIAAKDTSDPTVLDVLEAAEEISRLLDLPLRASGIPQTGSEELQSRLLHLSRRASAVSA
jgi:hypothetical protein